TSTSIDNLMMDLSRKLHVTTLVVTHEMDSAFRIADRMIMLEAGRILKAGTRAEFDAIRMADPQRLSDPKERLIHPFLTGEDQGPVTDGAGLSLYEKLLIGGDRTTIFRRTRSASMTKS